MVSTEDLKRSCPYCGHAWLGRKETYSLQCPVCHRSLVKYEHKRKSPEVASG